MESPKENHVPQVKPPDNMWKINVRCQCQKFGSRGWRFGQRLQKKLGYGVALNYWQATITTAEIIANEKGLSTAWERRFQNVIVESSSSKVVELIMNPMDGLHPLKYTILKFKALVGRPRSCSLNLNPRAANGCADTLAKLGHSLHMDEFCTFHDPPPIVGDIQFG